MTHFIETISGDFIN